MNCPVFLIMFLVVGCCNGARILALAPIKALSHFIVFEPLYQELAARGHEVTVFSPFPQKESLPNYIDVDISKNETRHMFSIEIVKSKMATPFTTSNFIEEITRFCDLIKEPYFQNILNDPKGYDLVISEVFGPDCMAYFAYKLRAPLIAYTTTVAVPWASERFGIPDNPSYIPNFLLTFTPEMTLLERTYNTIVLLYTKFWHLYMYPREHRRIAEEAFGEPLPPLHEVVANTSLLLVNSYHALTQSRPFPPNVIEVGGIHIKQRKPLPQDLKAILDEAKNGVVVVSFGSVLKTSSLSQAVLKTFIKVFSSLPQTVIFKYEDTLLKTPPNVIIKKWLPQRDLLEHENVIAVVHHGGLASTIEAVYFSKPILGIPFFGDQFINIQSITQLGGGIQLDFDSITEEKLAEALREITTNSKYKEGMRQLSLQYRDRPMTALQSAVYWTEYVIRHQGAPHLRPASVSLPLYQYLLLDVIALLLTALIVVVFAIYWIFRFAMKKHVFKNKNKRD